MSTVASQLRRVPTAAAIVGTLDLLGAFANAYAHNGVTPLRVLQFIASGVYGRPAFNGGWTMAAAGLVFHYLIALTFTVVFFVLHTRFAALRRHRAATGLLYGVAVWAVMNLVVLPLSAVPSNPLKLVPAAISAAILVVCLGWPLAWLADRSSRG